MERRRASPEKSPNGPACAFATSVTKVEVHDSGASLTPLPEVDGFDAIIIAASVHQERHQETISDFVMGHCEQLNSKPTAFISVSLSAVLEYSQGEAQMYVDRLAATTDWQPHETDSQVYCHEAR